MMMNLKSALTVALLAATLAACGDTTAPETNTSDTASTTVPHGVSTDPNAATAFITSNAFVPETATDSKGDGVLRDADGRPYGYALLGEELPPLDGTLISGETYSSGNLDRWTVIDVWGIWCGDCRKDSPYAAELAGRIADEPTLDFLSIHTPSSAARADAAYRDYGSVQGYFDAMGFSFPTLVDTDASVRDALKISWTPSYLLVSPDGVVRGFRTDLSVSGENPVDAFLADVATVIEEAGG